MAGDRFLNEIMWSLKFRKRKSADISRRDFLKNIPFFEHLTDKQLKVMAQRLHERHYEENEYLFEINHPGAALFIIMRGEVAIESSSDPQSANQIAVVRGKEFIGELALLDESPRSASARAVKPTTAFVLFRGDLNRLAKTDPDITSEVYKTLAWIIGERLKATNRLQLGKIEKVA